MKFLCSGDWDVRFFDDFSLEHETLMIARRRNEVKYFNIKMSVWGYIK
jgi:hypothetical protein